jgi:SAF domain
MLRIAATAAAVLSVIALFIGAMYLRFSGETKGVPVVVAEQDIPAGTRIADDMVEVAHVPNERVVECAFADPALVVGQFTKLALASGEQVVSSNVTANIGYLGGPAPPISGAGFFKGVRVFTLQIEPVTTEGESVSDLERVNIEISDGGAITVVENVEVRAVLFQWTVTRSGEAISVAVDPEQERILSEALSNSAMVKLSRAACEAR